MILAHSEYTVKIWNLGWSGNGGCVCTLARVGAVTSGGRCRCLPRQELGEMGERFTTPAWLGDGVVDVVCGSFHRTSPHPHLKCRPRDRGLRRCAARDQLASSTTKRARLVISPPTTPYSGHVRGNVPRLVNGYLLRLEHHPAVARLFVLCRTRLNHLARTKVAPVNTIYYWEANLSSYYHDEGAPT